MRENEFLGFGAGGFHRLHYTEWGERDHKETVICVHGLTRQARDFDPLATVLSDRFHVACMDVVGRGRSGWLADGAGYGYPQYTADAVGLINRIDARAVNWVGTSMGGLIGMMLAAAPRSPIRRLVINDVGALIPKAALERIAGYVGDHPTFADLNEAEAYIRRVAAPFGPLTDGQWRHLTIHGLRRLKDGGYSLHYDPKIAEPFNEAIIDDVDLWALWDRINIPVLLIRGAQSDILPREVAREMRGRGPGCKLVEINDCGHAPALMDKAQTHLIREWLLET